MDGGGTADSDTLVVSQEAQIAAEKDAALQQIQEQEKLKEQKEV